MTKPEPLLEVTNVQVVYGGAVEAVRDVSLSLQPGTMVALMGANGAGKSTLLKAISGILGPEEGEVLSGSIRLDGKLELEGMTPDQIVRHGITHVPEGRRLFSTLTVRENLQAGGYGVGTAERSTRTDAVFEIFPALKDHQHRIAGYLSGGQQQMVAIGRALMRSPRVLMLDEPSLGLAPKITDEIFERLVAFKSGHGLTVLLVEQNAHLALDVADYAYVMERGRIVLDGLPSDLKHNAEIRESYLGFRATGERKSMRDVKHYKRRKRWLS